MQGQLGLGSGGISIMRQLIRQVLRQNRFLLSHNCRTKCDFCLQVCCLSCLGLVHICLLIVSRCLEIGRRVSPSLNDETNFRLIILRAEVIASYRDASAQLHTELLYSLLQFCFCNKYTCHPSRQQSAVFCAIQQPTAPRRITHNETKIEFKL